MAPVKSLLRKLRKINQSRNQIRAEPILAREARDESPTSGLAMGLFSAGFPTGVEGHLPHLTQRTGFFSLPGWAT